MPTERQKAKQIKQQKRIIVVAGGEVNKADLAVIQPHDTILAVDAGVLPILDRGLLPHMLVGDFDTLEKEKVEELQAQGVSTYVLPTDKSLTDTHFALQMALTYNPDQVLVLGALGGNRLDHMMANVGLLEWLYTKGVPGVLVHGTNWVYLLVGPATGYFAQKGFTYLSILPITEKAEQIETQGLKYPLVKETLYRGDTRGISNEWITEEATIKIEKGKCLVIQSRDR